MLKEFFKGSIKESLRVFIIGFKAVDIIVDNFYLSL